LATVFLVNSKAFEPWSWASPNDPGIGGSETMVCEVAWRLAARGHQVTVYAPIPDGTGAQHRGVLWRHVSQADYSQPGLWILVRGLELLDEFLPGHPHQHVWVVFQDVDVFPREWQPEWEVKADRIIGLCMAHCAYLKQAHPQAADIVCQSRNGLRGDLVDQVLAETPPLRNPHRLMYASSPDRGLYGLLQAFKLMRFVVPDCELHVFYGFDNLDKIERAAVRWQAGRIQKLLDQPGVVVHGRRGQPELYREWLQSGLMVAPTNFTETGYICLLEAQALGAVPITNPIWAAGEYQLAGIQIPGDCEQDQLTLRRYAMAAIYLMQHPELQDEIRPEMMAQARKRYDWEDVVRQYEEWMRHDELL